MASIAAANRVRPTKTLPEGYILRATLDLSKNVAAMIGITLLSVVPLVVSGWFFFQMAALLRPGIVELTGSGIGLRLGGASVLGMLGMLGAALLLLPVLHELAHGCFFWLFTRERPVYGWQLIYAYAGAPTWYLPRDPYLIVGLAPLVLISLLGLALLAIVPIMLLPGLLLLMILNAAGAVVDILVVVWLLTQPRGTLVRDTGLVFMMYTPVA